MSTLPLEITINTNNQNTTLDDNEIIPKATRTMGVIRFDKARTTFFNIETLDENTQNVSSKWHIQRFFTYAITCCELDPLVENKKSKGMCLKFYGLKKRTRSTLIYVPLVWVPRTLLLLIAQSAPHFKSVLSIVWTRGNFDVNMMLEHNKEIKHLNKKLASSICFSKVEGGIY